LIETKTSAESAIHCSIMYGTNTGMNRAFSAPIVGFSIIPGALPQAEGESRAVGAEAIRQHHIAHASAP
jgi:hypothetical protein